MLSDDIYGGKAMDMRSRLSRIRSLRAGGTGQGGFPPEEAFAAGTLPPQAAAVFREEGWAPLGSPAGALTLGRTHAYKLPIPIPETLPAALSILTPGGGGLRAETLRFFDLETTGLSTGAGTIAFLAAFGLLEKSGRAGGEGNRGSYTGIRIAQYLLLDYPGEGEFLGALIKEFHGKRETGIPPAMVSYNGKTFDAQILRNRCLMQGVRLPVFDHLDLLHSARRLWRGVLPNCSQATVETEILSLSREGDLSGAFAPEAWFDFLNSGESGGLLQICDHNSRDILGLAAILGCLCRIAADPLGEGGRYSADMERLAICWQRILGRAGALEEYGEEEFRRARLLLERGAALGYPWCSRKLAIEAEWREADIRGALDLVERALGSPAGEMPGWLRTDLEGRRERLLAKSRAGKRTALKPPLGCFK
jgi:uncharacterized protein YprB with RNaseH-like and TPR domain